MLKTFDLLPTPLNMANDASASGFVNLRTQQETNAGGLVLGDCFDCDDRFAFQQCNPAIGLLYQGRYRRVQVDVNATAANVAIGRVCYVVPGASLLAGLLITAGSGQTPGTYQVSATGGGGTGAIIQVVVSAAGTVVQQPTVVAAGSGYTTTPTFTLVTGGTPATVQAMMVFNTYIVTTADKSGIDTSAPRGVFLNTITPGNYGWIQENGVATVLQTTSVTSSTVGAVVTPVAAGNGSVQSTVASAALLPNSIGVSIDAPQISVLFRVNLELPVWNG